MKAAPSAASTPLKPLPQTSTLLSPPAGVQPAMPPVNWRHVPGDTGLGVSSKLPLASAMVPACPAPAVTLMLTTRARRLVAKGRRPPRRILVTMSHSALWAAPDHATGVGHGAARGQAE